jgi:hypothetical protein
VSLSHYATCSVWSTGNWQSCNCSTLPPWKIRKEPHELFAWRVWRLAEDGYEHLMRCSTWAGAISLVTQFIWMREHALQRESINAGEHDV